MRLNDIGLLSKVWVLAVALVGVLLAGIVAARVWGGEASVPEDGPARRPVTAGEAALLKRAEQELIRRCMVTARFAYWPVDEDWDPIPVRFRHVIADVAWARKHGYGMTQNQDPTSRYLASLTPERQTVWKRTLYGSGRGLVADIPDLGRLSTPDNGCTAQARRNLYRDLAGWYQVRRIVDHFDSYTFEYVTAAPEYRKGLAAWSACVRKRGYPASTPLELRRLATQTSQFAVAGTEARCAVSTGFSQAIGVLEARYRPQTERRFARELHALNSFEHAALSRARQALALPAP
jgi:hypothetical protein